LHGAHGEEVDAGREDNPALADDQRLTELRPDPEAAIKFLQLLRPDGPWLLVAIHPERKGAPGRTYTTLEQCQEFILAHNETENLYYSVNPARGLIDKKPSKAEIGSGEYLHADVDPAEGESPEQCWERLKPQIAAYDKKPTFIIRSGNGVHLLWRLTEWDGAKTIADVEARNYGLALAFGADASTRDVCRILRVPGTINWPTKKKREAGRVPALCQLIEANDVSYGLEEFAPAEAPAKKTRASKSDRKASSKEAKQGKGRDETGSGYGMRFFMPLVAQGVGEEEAYAKIAEHQGRAGTWYRRVDERQHQRAWEEAVAVVEKRQADDGKEDDAIAEINRSYALVLVGDKTAVMKESADGFSFMKVTAFKQWFSNQHIQYGGRSVRLAEHWLAHPQRRQYEGVEFAPGGEVPPGYSNLWRSFAVEPRKGDCSKFLAHVHDNVCQESERRFNWVMGWAAEIFQKPRQRSGTSLVLRGEEGVGKTKFGEVLGSLLGQRHYALVSEPRYVTGRFNSHLKSCLLLHADEAWRQFSQQAAERGLDRPAPRALLLRACST
jgi:hypothetical protein